MGAPYLGEQTLPATPSFSASTHCPGLIKPLFKGLQQSRRLHEWPTRSETTAKILICTALIWVALAGWLRQTIVARNERADSGILRLVCVLREWGEHLLSELAVQYLGARPIDLFERFCAQRLDRNVYRERTRHRLDHRAFMHISGLTVHICAVVVILYVLWAILRPSRAIL